MQEKTKKWLLSLAVRAMVAVTAAIVILMLNSFVPKTGEVTKGVLTKNTDVQKIGTLFGEILKEVLP